MRRDDRSGRVSARPRRPAPRAARAGPAPPSPTAALDRLGPGHWEGNRITGTGDASAIVERTTRYTLLGHLAGTRHDAASVRDVVVAALGDLPADLRRTLAWDQGSEMARQAEIDTAALGAMEIPFCDPPSPWQRPSNENTNGLLRACFPKGTDRSAHSAQDIALVRAELNLRPRKILGWDSPADRLITRLGSPALQRR